MFDRSQSGTAQFIDDACGSYRCDVIFRDTNVAQVKAVPDEAIHRAVDLVVLDGDQEGRHASMHSHPRAVLIISAQVTCTHTSCSRPLSMAWHLGLS
jgi:hypothetical protein